MSNYTKTTDFEAKDSLPTGDSGKIIRGSEFETEFDAISTAIATKADTAGPTFTGTLTFETISDGTIGVTAFVDEDDMSSDSATLVPTQQSVKAYVDSQVTAQDLDFQADSGGALSIDLDTETMTFTGGTGIDTSGSGNDVEFAIDSTVATLTDTQTLTNKTLTSPDVNTPDIDGGTIDGATIATSDITVGTGKTLNVSSGTLTLADDQISGDKVEGGTIASTTITSLASTTVDTTNLEVTNIKAKDGTSAGSIADSTGVVTLASSVLTTADINGGTIDGATIGGTTAAAGSFTTVSATGNITVDGTVDGRDVATDGTKLDGIEALADVTDTTNVTAAGALMDSEVTNLDQVKAFDSADYATAAQGTTADSALQNVVEDTTPQLGGDLDLNSNDITGTGNIDVTGTVTADGGTIVSTGSDAFSSKAVGGYAIQAYQDATSSGHTALDLRSDATTGTRYLIRGYNDAAGTPTEVFSVGADGTVTADGLTVDGSTTITTADNNAQLTVISTDTDASVGPRIDLYRNSSSPANGDLIGEIQFQGEDSIGVFNIFATISSKADQVDNGSEDGSLHFKTLFNGTLANRLSIGGSGSGDISFYEDTGTTAKLFWDASAESLGIGTSSPSTKLDILSDSNSSLVNIARFASNNNAVSIGIGYNEIRQLADANSLNFGVHSGTAMTILDGGNVGIGTGSPAVLLDIAEGTAATDAIIGLTAGTGGRAQIRSEAQADNTSSELSFYTMVSSATNERMRIDSNGNVGIGTDSPQGLLHVDGFDYSYFSGNVGSATLDNEQGLAIGWNKSSGGGETVLIANQGAGSTGGMVFATNTSAGAYNERMSIDSSGNVQVDTGNVSLQGNGSQLTTTYSGITTSRFYTSTSGLNLAVDGAWPLMFSNNSTERMRIDASGNLLVGTTDTSLYANTSGSGVTIVSDELGVARSGSCAYFNRMGSDGTTVVLFNRGVNVGSISTTSSATAYNTSSDQRLKDNIVDAPSASDDIDAIQVRSFDWKVDGSHQKYGMVAQELQSVAPEAVSVGETEEDMMGVDYSKLVPMLVKEIQSLRARVAQLEGAN